MRGLKRNQSYCSEVLLGLDVGDNLSENGVYQLNITN